MDNPTPLRLWYALHLFAIVLGINAVFVFGNAISLPMPATWGDCLLEARAPLDWRIQLRIATRFLRASAKTS